MKVIGIDCGLAMTGWAVIEQNKGSKEQKVHAYGVIKTPSGAEAASRLKTIYDDLVDLIKEYKPDHIAVEDLFFFKNQKTIITVGQARGVIMLAGVALGLEMFHYTPLQVKMSVAGYGRAEKDQVQKMVKAILNLKEIPRPDDAADALAIAVCHLNTI